ncbi:MAG TPA: hypothetical protein VN844_22060, partial [Pyrinomonadaceae bacterium]|nr:hypothetical protein [Pyrinomonadaceae bacterium]
WSMAQFIRLALNLKHRRNLETPAVVAERYLRKALPQSLPGASTMESYGSTAGCEAGLCPWIGLGPTQASCRRFV